MMRVFYFFLISIFSFQVISGQQIQFERVLPLQPSPQYFTDFSGARNSALAFADVDGDNDIDVLISGGNRYSGHVNKTVLYINNGMGSYEIAPNTPFVNLEYGDIAFADIDGDNDQDVLIVGKIWYNDQIFAKLYTNDGGGHFTEVTGTPFEAVYNGSIAFTDIDGDNDQDLIITGTKHSNNYRVAKLYTNDGIGNFTEVLNTPFDDVANSSIALADIDGDNDQDLLITGGTSSVRIAKLYTNDGVGNFTEVTGTPFTGVSDGSIAFADIDGDNDQDVLITGAYDYGNNHHMSKLYTNDGMGIFTEITNTPFADVTNSSIAFADVDIDNDQDVLITGRDQFGRYVSNLYVNDGIGNFTQVSMPFESVFHGSVGFLDVDNDSDLDLIITGTGNTNNTITDGVATLYLNNGNGSFEKVVHTSLEALYDASTAFADVDGDGDDDLLIAGLSNSAITGRSNVTKLYINDGDGNFVEDVNTPFIDVRNSSVAFTDIDGDNDQDVLITGVSSNGRVSKLYFNDGSGTFIESSSSHIYNSYKSTTVFVDIDGDNDKDLVIGGVENNNNYVFRFYINNGIGDFVYSFPNISCMLHFVEMAFADVDGDNDQDMIICGEYNYHNYSKLYLNDGTGNFTELRGTPFIGVARASIAFADIDGDNDQDVFISGLINDYECSSKLYTNDGHGHFTEATGTSFIDVGKGDAVFKDFDNDGDQDLLMTGYHHENPSYNTYIARIYANDGIGNFTSVDNSPFIKVLNSSVAVADIDNDNDLDLLITGQGFGNKATATLYRNITGQANIFESKSLSLSVYPNPSKGKFSIEINNESIQKIGVYNLQGQEVPFKFINEDHILQLDLPKGIYLLSLTINDIVNVQKIVLE